MKMSRKVVSFLLAVMMLFSMATMAVSAYTVPDGYQIADSGVDETTIDGEVYGLLGDPDLNDRVNVRDATAIQKHAADLEAFDEMQLVLADIDFSGAVNVKDATAIQKWAADMEVNFPINHLIYAPTTESTDPTDAPVNPTDAPVNPTDAPVNPTDAPVNPTDAPVNPTDAPVNPTDAPVNPTDAPVNPTDAPDDGMYTIYFSNNRFWDTVYIYGFYGEEGKEGSVPWPCDFPGVEMNFVEVNEYGQDVYSYDVPADISYIKFANGPSDSSDYARTNNIPNSMLHDNAGFYLTTEIGTSNGKKWDIGTYEYIPEIEDTDPTDVTEPSLPATGDEATGDEATKDEVIDDGMITVYFTNNRGWDKVYIYGFYGEEGQPGAIPWPGDYPGEEMNYVGVNEYGQDVYSHDVPEDLDYIKFSNGGSKATNYRTNNIPNSVIYDNIQIYLTTESDLGENGKKWDYATTTYDGTEPEETTAPSDPVEETTAPVAGDTITVYFTNNRGWDKVYIYGFYGEEGQPGAIPWPKDYPGEEMTYVGPNELNQDVYSHDVPADIDYIKFSNGGSGATNYRTNNIPNSVIYDNIQIYLTTESDLGENGKKWDYATTTYDGAEPEETTAPSDPVEETTAPSDPEEETTAPVVETITVYFTNNRGWEKVYIYGFYGEEGQPGAIPWPKDYPGEEMTYVGPNELNQDVYSHDVPKDLGYIKFSNGGSGATNYRTNNIPNSVIYDNVQIYLTTESDLGENGKKWDYKTTTYGETTPTEPPTTAPTEPPTTAPTEPPLPDSGYVIQAESSNWSDVKLYTVDDTTLTATVQLEAGSYSFKLKDANGAVYGCNGTITEANAGSNYNFRTQTTTVLTLNAAAGTYTFTVKINSNRLTLNFAYDAQVVETPTEPPTEAPTDPPAADEMTVYCINSANWDAVYVYGWDANDNNNSWPGVQMTKTDKSVNGFDVYSATISASYVNVIFNAGKDTGIQTENLTANSGQYYDVKGKAWYTSLDDVPAVDPLATDRYLVGTFNGWSTSENEFKRNTAGEAFGYVTLTLEAGETIEFKVVRDGKWTSPKSVTTITGTVEGITFSSSGVQDNVKLTATVAGEYVFAFGVDNSQLSVTYPD